MNMMKHMDKETGVKEAVLSLEGLSKAFAEHRVIDDLSLDVHDGEFFTLLGPSGCGKTTTLRIVAGLERPDAGVVRFRGVTWEQGPSRPFVPPQRRNIGMVFQNYAIWPHMTVFENVAYPLVIQKRPTDGVMDILDLVHLRPFADRPATRLSGGQQQRVALARALTGNPSLLLLDEPFSNLDVHLRESMRFELKHIQKTLGLTVILVTHDQLDAFSLSDRIGVMCAGRLVQVGGGLDVYERPVTPFVRDFVGTNVVLPGRLGAVDGDRVEVHLVGGGTLTTEPGAMMAELGAGAAVTVTCRPEDVRIVGADTAGAGAVVGIVDTVLYSGDHYECEIRVAPEAVVTAKVPRTRRPAEGETVALELDPGHVLIWPQET